MALACCDICNRFGAVATFITDDGAGEANASLALSKPVVVLLLPS